MVICNLIMVRLLWLSCKKENFNIYLWHTMIWYHYFIIPFILRNLLPLIRSKVYIRLSFVMFIETSYFNNKHIVYSTTCIVFSLYLIWIIKITRIVFEIFSSQVALFSLRAAFQFPQSLKEAQWFHKTWYLTIH